MRVIRAMFVMPFVTVATYTVAYGNFLCSFCCMIKAWLWHRCDMLCCDWYMVWCVHFDRICIWSFNIIYYVHNLWKMIRLPSCNCSVELCSDNTVWTDLPGKSATHLCSFCDNTCILHYSVVSPSELPFSNSVVIRDWLSSLRQQWKTQKKGYTFLNLAICIQVNINSDRYWWSV